MVIRRATIDDVKSISKVHVDTWRDAYEEILPHDYLQEKSYEEQEEKWKKRVFLNKKSREFMYVAEENGETVGFSSAGFETENEGIVFTIYVQKEFQGKGIGKALLKTVVKRLKVEGTSSVSIWAFEEVKSCRFYDYLGGVRREEQTIDVANKDITIICYHWEEIDDLLSRCEE